VPPNSRVGGNGIVVPARTPKDVVKKLNVDLIASVRSPEIHERFANLTVDTTTSTPQAFDAFMRSKIAFCGELVRNAGIKLDSSCRAFRSRLGAALAPARPQASYDDHSITI
jgi:Tripartite tricarboxylate transporter family receptor